MKSRKRISIILALAMVLSLFAAMPMTAFAATPILTKVGEAVEITQVSARINFELDSSDPVIIYYGAYKGSDSVQPTNEQDIKDRIGTPDKSGAEYKASSANCSWVIENLVPGKDYTVYVVAQTDDEVAFSNILTFSFTTPPYTITFNASGGSVTPASAITDGNGKLASLPTPTRSNYSFNGWFTASSGGTQITTSYVFTANTTIYAQWTSTGGTTSGGSGGTTPANPTGSFSGGSSYTVGGSTGLVYIVNKDFAQFNNVKVGTTTLVKDKDYKAENSSTKITLLPSYLDTLSAGTYTMTVGFKDSTIATAKFTVAAAAVQPITPTMPVNPFSDVKGTDWFIDDVIYAVSLGLIDGKTPTTFAPGDNLTYAEAVKLAACMHELYTTDKITLANGTPWYQSYVDYAKKNGIIDGDFDWNAPATRAGYMAIFAKALPADGLKAINDIADGAIPDVAMTDANAAAIYKLYKAGIVQGVDDDHNCNPDSNIKRSEVAAILTRMMDDDMRVKFSL